MEKKYKSAVNRMLFVLLVVVMIFALIISSKIVLLQVFKHDYYKNIVENARQTITTQAPRGKIYDRNGVLLVSNEEDIIIQYYPSKSLSEDEKWKLTDKFVKQFPIDAKLTQREKKDLYIFLHRNTIFQQKFTKEELKKIDSKELDKLVIDKITEEEINTLTQHQMNQFKVKMAIDYASSARTSVVKRGVSKEEAAYLVENKSEYPGFYVDFDWKRKYHKEDTFKSVLGKISSETQGLPIEESEYLLLKGYQLNDRIGISGLEKQYETYLRGNVSEVELSIDENGNMKKNYIKEGKLGNDVYLTIDIALQEKLNDILKQALQHQKQFSNKSEHALVSIMDAKTGEMLAMASQSLNLDDNKQTSYDSSSLAYLYGFSPGSSVKGATIYMGLDQGVVKPGEIIFDTPLHILGTPIKKSIVNMGHISELDALQRSSNVYMFHIAMRMGGAHYVPNQALVLDKELINKIRSYFTAFGLGAYTGLDVPNEALAYTGPASKTNNALDYVIGQYDQYTLIQMNQYVNTLANRGVKYRPFLVKKILDNQVVVFENQKHVLGVVKGNHQYFENVAEGFARTGKTYNGHRLSQKTGTADVENYYTTNTVVSFGPKDNPKISIACVVPFSYDERVASSHINPCTSIVGKVYEAYGSLYPF